MRTLGGCLAICLICLVGPLATPQVAAGSAIPAANSDGSAAAVTNSAAIVKAAVSFLATLSDEQRTRVLYSFSDDSQRARWSNFPVPIVPRGGLSLKELSSTQRAAAMTLLSTVLSRRGFEKVQQIMEADEVNKQNELRNPGGPRRRGPPGGFGPPGSSGPPGAPGGSGPPDARG